MTTSLHRCTGANCEYCRQTAKDQENIVEVEAATGVLCTEDEMTARKALTVLLGSCGIRNIGFTYREGYYDVYVLGEGPAPEPFGRGFAHVAAVVAECRRPLELSVFQQLDF